MNFTCQRPEALYAIFLLIPALVFGIYHYRQVMNNYKKITIKDSDFLPARRIKKYRITILARSVFLSLFWIMLVLAMQVFPGGLTWNLSKKAVLLFLLYMIFLTV